MGDFPSRPPGINPPSLPSWTYFSIIFQDRILKDFGTNLGSFWVPNLEFFRYLSSSFFFFIFGSDFFQFFVDSGSLETLKFVLPPAREHNFYKIDVLHFITKFGPKMIVLRVQNPCKIEENRRKKRVSKQVLFKHRFFSIFRRFWLPS